MDGQALSAETLGDAGLRRFATERIGPRPGGTPTARATDRGPRTARPSKP